MHICYIAYMKYYAKKSLYCAGGYVGWESQNKYT